MKKNKLIILLVILLSLTGCTFEYNIEINTSNIKEVNIIFVDNTTNDTIKQEVEKLINSYTGPTNSLGMYEQSIIERNGNFGMLYTKDYSNITDYNNSVSFSICYDNYKLVKETDKIIISTSKRFNCFNKYKELDNVTINIKSNLEVISSNADEVNDNVYTWNINKGNYEDKPITISLIPNTDKSKVNKKKEMDVFILVILAITLLGIIILLLGLRSKKKNKI